MEFAAGKDIGASKALGISTKRIDGGDQFRINLTREDLIDNVDRRFVGHALSLNKSRGYSAAFECPGDGFTASVNDDGIYLNTFQEYQIPSDGVADCRVWGIHK